MRSPLPFAIAFINLLDLFSLSTNNLVNAKFQLYHELKIGIDIDKLDSIEYFMLLTKLGEYLTSTQPKNPNSTITSLDGLRSVMNK